MRVPWRNLRYFFKKLNNMKYKFKVLKHKDTADIFGHINSFNDEINEKDCWEIFHMNKPSYLLGEETTMELLKEYWKEYPQVIRELVNYDLITVELKEL